eukprot:gene19625-21557_t
MNNKPNYILESSISCKRHVVDRLLFNERCLEEIEFIEREKSSYSKYYADLTLPTLERKKESCVNILLKSRQAVITADSRNCSYNIAPMETSNSETIETISNKYRVQHLIDDDVANGVLALINKGIHFAKSMLRQGYESFEIPTTRQIAMPSTSSSVSPCLVSAPEVESNLSDHENDYACANSLMEYASVNVLIEGIMRFAMQQGNILYDYYRKSLQDRYCSIAEVCDQLKNVCPFIVREELVWAVEAEIDVETEAKIFAESKQQFKYQETKGTNNACVLQVRVVEAGSGVETKTETIAESKQQFKDQEKKATNRACISQGWVVKAGIDVEAETKTIAELKQQFKHQETKATTRACILQVWVVEAEIDVETEAKIFAESKQQFKDQETKATNRACILQVWIVEAAIDVEAETKTIAKAKQQFKDQEKEATKYACNLQV